jgi:hypothetical protein
MTLSTAWDDFSAGYAQGYPSGNARTQRAFAAAALVCVAFASAYCAWTNLSGTPAEPVIAKASRLPVDENAAAKFAAVAAAYGKLSTALRTAYAKPAVAANAVAQLFDSHPLGFAPGAFAKIEAETVQVASSAVQGAEHVAQRVASATRDLHVPAMRTPPSRDIATVDRGATGSTANAIASAANNAAREPSIFERLFGKPAPVTLAYASAEDGGLGDGRSIVSGRYDRETAVYDISAHVVYMPDGTTLEAHSGLGAWLDDPNHTDERMRGATPAGLYDLKLRESLFHGVQAIRLVPVDENKVFGRSGLLAHTFMLGTNGQSNGCVSFRNYNAFLHAFLNRDIKRLAVVTRL